MGKRHVQYGSREIFEENTIVGLVLDESYHIATPALQDVGKVFFVASYNVAMVLGELPVLIGDGRYLHLQNGECI